MDNAFDDLSSHFVGLVPDLIKRDLTGLPGARDDVRNESSPSFERLIMIPNTQNIQFSSTHTHALTHAQHLFDNQVALRWGRPNYWTYFLGRSGGIAVATNVNMRGDGMPDRKQRDDDRIV